MAAPTPSFSFRNVLLIVVPVAIIAALGSWYYTLQADRQLTQTPNPMRNFLRLNLIAPTKLDAGLIDGDGDLVAGAPADAKEQIDPETLVFVVLGQDADKEAAQFADLAAYLAKVTGKKVDVTVSADPIPDQMLALRSGKTHLAAFSTGSVSTAVNKGGFIPFCVMADEKGIFGYEMEIVVPADSPAKTPADLKGKSISFVSAYSHSGFKVPVVTLWKEFDLQPGVNYTPSFAGSHETIVDGIAKGPLAAGAVASDLYKRMVGAGEVDPKAIRTIYTSKASFPSQCFGYAHQLKPELAAKVKKGFLEFPWKGSSLEKAYAAAGQSKFVPITYKADWAAVRQLEVEAEQLLDTEQTAKK